MSVTTDNYNLNINVNADPSMKSIGMMKQEIRSLEQAMQAAAKAGDTVTFNKLSAQMGMLKNDMIDFKAKMKYLDPGELLGGYVKLAQGMIGSFAAVTGAMTLFGGESKKVQEIQKKSMAIIQIMMGLESARKILIDVGGRAEVKAILTTTAAQIQKLFITKASTVATVGAETAQLGLNAAMLANPIGLILVALAALVAALIYFTSTSDEAAQAQRKYNDVMKETDEITKRLKESMDAYILSRKEQGASEAELYDLQINKLQEFKINQEAAMRDMLWNMKGLTSAEKVEFQKKIQNWTNLTEKEKTELIKQFGNMKNLTDEQKEDFKTRADALEQTNKDITQLNHEKNMLLFNQDKEAEKMHIENMQEGRKKDLEMALFNEKEDLRKADQNQKLRTEIIAAYNKKVGEINKKWNDIEQKARDDADKKRLEDEKNRNERLKKILEEEKKFEQDMLEFKIKMNKKGESLPDFESENIKSKMKEQKQYAEFVLENDESTLEEKIESRKKLAELTYLEEFTEAKSQRNREQAWKKYQRNIKKIDDDASKERIAKIKEDAEDIADMLKSVMGSMVDISNAYFENQNIELDRANEKYKNSYDERNEILTKAIEDAKNLYGEDSDAYRNAVRQKEDADAAKAKQEEEYEKKKRRMQRDAWNVQHAGDIVNATSALALAVVNAWNSRLGPEVGLAMSIVAASLGAVQLGIIAGQKNPYKRRGGLIDGNSHEDGGVNIEAEGGEVVLNKNSMRNPSFRAIANQINMAGGGVPVPMIGTSAQNQSAISASLNPQDLDYIVNKITSIPVVVVENDISQAQYRRKVLLNKTIIG